MGWDYASGGRCVGCVDVREVQAWLASLPGLLGDRWSVILCFVKGLQLVGCAGLPAMGRSGV